MAKFIKVKLHGLTDKKLAKAITEKLGKAGGVAGLSRQVKSYVISQITQAIGGKGLAGTTKAAIAFQPHKQSNSTMLIGKLGVGHFVSGRGGKIDYEKLSGAWAHTLPRSSGILGLANVSGKFSIKGIGGGRLGVFEYSLSKEKLYNGRLATFGYFNRKDEGGLVVIPWLRHYIEGVQIGGYEFSLSPKYSRTNIGIMSKVPGSAFEIPPLNIDPFGEILKAIERRFKSKNFRNGFTAIIKRAIKDK